VKPAKLINVGLYASSKVFTPMANELHGNFHCFALDIRGHGQSAYAATIDGAFAAPLGKPARSTAQQ
jgi:pimeloyl-ACP methyl ester carboxylesterase